MRYMRWGWEQLLTCPADYVPVIVEEAHREAQAAKSRANSRK